MYGGNQQVQSTHKEGGGAPALRTTMRLWHLWSLQREGWFYASFLSPSGFVSFHVCLWISAWSSYHHSAVTCMMCVQMWRLVDFSAILGCESTLTGIDGLARELQGPSGSDPRSWITGTAIGFCMVLEIWTRVHMAVQQVISPGLLLWRMYRKTALSPFTITWSRQTLLTHLMWDGTSFIWQLGWRLSTLNDSDATNGDVMIIKQQRGILFSSILLHIQGRKVN